MSKTTKVTNTSLVARNYLTNDQLQDLLKIVDNAEGYEASTDCLKIYTESQIEFKISADIIQDFFTNVENHGEGLFQSTITPPLGIDAWFKAYIQSEDFRNLRNDSKAEAFEIFTKVKEFHATFYRDCMRHDYFPFPH